MDILLLNFLRVIALILGFVYAFTGLNFPDLVDQLLGQ